MNMSIRDFRAFSSFSASFSALDQSDNWAITLVMLSGGLLFGALIVEHALTMAPCPLCLMQRIWFFVAGAIAYASLLHNARWGIYPFSIALAACAGGGFAIRQLYLQGLPVDQVLTCGPDLAYMLEVLPLSDVLIAMTQGTGDCAQSAALFGVELPVWALLGYTAVVAMAVLQWRAGTK
jgi:disulfide bond formation protein DsbB